MAALRQPPRHIVIGIAALLLVACFVVFTPRTTRGDTIPTGRGTSHTRPTSAPRNANRLYGKDYKGHASPIDINRVANETLGFEKIFVIGLPERSDKRDAIALTSTSTGFHVEWVDGVKGETVPDKAVPFGADRKKLWETNLGSWRGHMNAIRRIVEEDLGSALIMEDDMDWDVRLKPQLERVAQGARALLASAARPNSPYGDDWDLMWLGHCGEVFPELLDENKEKPVDDPGVKYMSRKFVIENDLTVPRGTASLASSTSKAAPSTRVGCISQAPLYVLSRTLFRNGEPAKFSSTCR